MFLSSVLVPSSSSPAGRTETLASQRSEPFSMSQSDTPIVRERVACSSARNAHRLLGRAQVGLGHDLDQRRAAAVEVHQRGVGARDPPARAAGVHQLGRVLLEVRAGDADRAAVDLEVAGPQIGWSYWLIWYALGLSG